MDNVHQIDTCLGYGDGVDVFFNADKLNEAQHDVNETARDEDREPDTVVVVLEIPTRRAALDIDGIGYLRAALDAAEAAFKARRR